MAARRHDDTLEELHQFCLDKQRRTIYVHSEFSEPDESGVDWRMASRFIKNLDYLQSLSDNPIFIKLISIGGDWNTGMAIYDAIAKSPCHITTISYAHARSMSSIIIQAADHRQITKHSDFMVHYGTYCDEGDFRQVANGLKHYERANDVMFDIYTNRCKTAPFFKDYAQSKVKSFIKKKINDKTDWWMTAEEALHYGFVDEII